MKKLINNWLYNKAVQIVMKRLLNSETLLTEQYLIDKGWDSYYDQVRHKRFWFEPNMKDRDVIYIDFELHFYRVWHSSNMTFIACESSIEWFDLYYKLAHPDNRRYAAEKIYKKREVVK